MVVIYTVCYNPKYHYSKSLCIFHYKFHFFFIYLSILAKKIVISKKTLLEIYNPALYDIFHSVQKYYIM